jgi:hypothetical protein
VAGQISETLVDLEWEIESQRRFLAASRADGGGGERRRKEINSMR